MLPRLAALACCLTLLACARTSQVSTRFMGDSPAAPATRLLLVARMPETEQRREWEQACLKRLNHGDALLVTASSSALPNWYEGGNDQLLAWAREHGNATVLVFELTGLLLAPFSMPPGNVVSSERFPNEDPIGDPTWTINLGRSEEKPPELPETIETDVRLIAANGDVLWEGLTYTHEANDLAAIARSQCAAVQDTLSGLGHLPDQKGLLPFISGR